MIIETKNRKKKLVKKTPLSVVLVTRNGNGRKHKKATAFWESLQKPTCQASISTHSVTMHFPAPEAHDCKPPRVQMEPLLTSTAVASLIGQFMVTWRFTGCTVPSPKGIFACADLGFARCHPSVVTLSFVYFESFVKPAVD